MSEKLRFFKLSPELADGQHWTVCDTDDRGIDSTLDAIEIWLQEMAESGATGESFTVELVEMTQEEVDALPDI